MITFSSPFELAQFIQDCAEDAESINVDLRNDTVNEIEEAVLKTFERSDWEDFKES